MVLIAVTTGDAGGGLSTGLTLMIVGMGVVFSALVLIMGVITLAGRMLREKPAPGESSVSRAEALPESGEVMTPELIAVLTAAAYAAVGGPVRMMSVRRLVSSGDGSVWVSSGRQALMASHRVRRSGR